jgi:hypothetical protein
MKLLIMQFSQNSRHFNTLQLKCSPQHPVLKHPQCKGVLDRKYFSSPMLLNNICCHKITIEIEVIDLNEKKFLRPANLCMATNI